MGGSPERCSMQNKTSNLGSAAQRRSSKAKGDSIYRASLKMVRDVQGPWRGGARLLPCRSVLFTDGLRDTRCGVGEGGQVLCVRVRRATPAYAAVLVEIRRSVLSSRDGEGGG